MFYLRRAAPRLLSPTPLPISFTAKARPLPALCTAKTPASAWSALLRTQLRWSSDDALARTGRDDTAGHSRTLEHESAGRPRKPMSDEERSTGGARTAARSGDGRRSSPQGSSTPLYPPNNVLYVGNLYFDVSHTDLAREFSNYGDVLNSRVIHDARGLSRGFGYVTFGTVEQAVAARDNLNQQLFEGRRLTVQYRRPDDNRARAQSPSANPRSKAPSRTLFIGNMSFAMTDQDLNELFRDVRNVIDVRVAIDRRTGQPRGFAHADFIDVASAEKAKELLETKEAYGRNLRVDFSYSTRDSQPGDQQQQQEQEQPQDGNPN